MALLAGLALFSRITMNAGLHPFEVVFLRNLFACLMLLPLLVYRGRSLLLPAALASTGSVSSISLLSMLAWFYAISLIPIGEVTAISFLAPLFGTLGADLPARRGGRVAALDRAPRRFRWRHDHTAPHRRPLRLGTALRRDSRPMAGIDRRSHQAADDRRRPRQDRLPDQRAAGPVVADPGAVRVALAVDRRAAAAAGDGGVRRARPRQRSRAAMQPPTPRSPRRSSSRGCRSWW